MYLTRTSGFRITFFFFAVLYTIFLLRGNFIKLSDVSDYTELGLSGV